MRKNKNKSRKQKRNLKERHITHKLPSKRKPKPKPEQVEEVTFVEVPSLFSLCTSYIVQNIAGCSSLDGIDFAVLNEMLNRLKAMPRVFSKQALKVILAAGATMLSFAGHKRGLFYISEDWLTTIKQARGLELLDLSYQSLTDDGVISLFRDNIITCVGCGLINPAFTPSTSKQVDLLLDVVQESRLVSLAGKHWREYLLFCGVGCEKEFFKAIQLAKMTKDLEEKEEVVTEALSNFNPKTNILGLSTLRLGYTETTDEFFQHLTLLTNLTDLDVSSTDITIDSFEGLSTLVKLNISACGENLAEYLDQLNEILPQLTDLNVSKIRPMPPATICTFALFPSLTRLSMRKCRLGTKHLEAITELVAIEELDICKNPKLGEEDAQLIVQALPSLQRLHWGQDFEMTQDSVNM